MTAPNDTTTYRFGLGDPGPVKWGTRAPDYDDVPLGGWAGPIRDRGPSPEGVVYLLGLDDRTLRELPDAYRQRCARDGLILEELWLAEDDLEHDTGDPLPIETPAGLPAP